ncbi:MAG: hypothetical protein ACI840_002070 [Ulvibacter sp.]|jgi:hypothetical protein
MVVNKKGIPFSRTPFSSFLRINYSLITFSTKVPFSVSTSTSNKPLGKFDIEISEKPVGTWNNLLPKIEYIRTLVIAIRLVITKTSFTGFG